MNQMDGTNEVERRIVAALERKGIRALNPPAGFPMEAGPEDGIDHRRQKQLTRQPHATDI
jgi:hypothetical protein